MLPHVCWATANAQTEGNCLTCRSRHSMYHPTDQFRQLSVANPAISGRLGRAGPNHGGVAVFRQLRVGCQGPRYELLSQGEPLFTGGPHPERRPFGVSPIWAARLVVRGPISRSKAGRHSGAGHQLLRVAPRQPPRSHALLLKWKAPVVCTCCVVRQSFFRPRNSIRRPRNMPYLCRLPLNGNGPHGADWSPLCKDSPLLPFLPFETG